MVKKLLILLALVLPAACAPTLAPAACFVVGDSIAQMVVAPYLPCKSRTRVGEHTSVIIGWAHPADLVVISAGSNDDVNEALTRNLRELRVRAYPARVVWIKPVNTAIANEVIVLANIWGDRVVSFVPARDNVHPRHPDALAREIMK